MNAPLALVHREVIDACSASRFCGQCSVCASRGMAFCEPRPRRSVAAAGKTFFSPTKVARLLSAQHARSRRKGEQPPRPERAGTVPESPEESCYCTSRNATVQRRCRGEAARIDRDRLEGTLALRRDGDGISTGWAEERCTSNHGRIMSFRNPPPGYSQKNRGAGLPGREMQKRPWVARGPAGKRYEVGTLSRAHSRYRSPPRGRVVGGGWARSPYPENHDLSRGRPKRAWRDSNPRPAA
jgi:hypothetical protein